MGWGDTVDCVDSKGIKFVNTGTREHKIPYPTSNPMTKLFNFVSCPNYTYEVGW